MSAFATLSSGFPMVPSGAFLFSLPFLNIIEVPSCERVSSSPESVADTDCPSRVTSISAADFTFQLPLIVEPKRASSIVSSSLRLRNTSKPIERMSSTSSSLRLSSGLSPLMRTRSQVPVKRDLSAGLAPPPAPPALQPTRSMQRDSAATIVETMTGMRLLMTTSFVRRGESVPPTSPTLGLVSSCQLVAPVGMTPGPKRGGQFGTAGPIGSHTR